MVRRKLHGRGRHAAVGRAVAHGLRGFSPAALLRAAQELLHGFWGFPAGPARVFPAPRASSGAVGHPGRGARVRQTGVRPARHTPFMLPGIALFRRGDPHVHVGAFVRQLIGFLRLAVASNGRRARRREICAVRHFGRLHALLRAFGRVRDERAAIVERAAAKAASARAAGGRCAASELRAVGVFPGFARKDGRPRLLDCAVARFVPRAAPRDGRERLARLSCAQRRKIRRGEQGGGRGPRARAGRGAAVFGLRPPDLRAALSAAVFGPLSLPALRAVAGAAAKGPAGAVSYMVHRICRVPGADPVPVLRAAEPAAASGMRSSDAAGHGCRFGLCRGRAAGRAGGGCPAVLGGQPGPVKPARVFRTRPLFDECQ